MRYLSLFVAALFAVACGGNPGVAGGSGSGGTGSGGGSVDGGTGGGGGPTAVILRVHLNGSGRVTSNPAGIDCGNACTAQFDSGARVSLGVTAAPGFSFAGFGGACSGTSCSISLSSDSDVWATFTANPVSLVISFAGESNGRVISNPGGLDCRGPGSCKAKFDAGTQVQLTAIPDALTMVSWSAACAGAVCALRLDSDVAITVRFDNQRYAIQDLGTLPGKLHSLAAGISPNGSYVTGSSNSGENHAIIWDGAMHDTSVLGNGQAVSDSGLVAGLNGGGIAPIHAFTWQNGKMKQLAGLSGDTQWVNGVNASGVVVGWATRSDGIARAVYWNGDGIHDLGSLGGANGCSFAYGNNPDGLIVGESCLSAGGTHAVRWRDIGMMDDLSPAGSDYGRASAISANGLIAGITRLADGTYHGFIWSKGALTVADSPPGVPNAGFYGINSAGIVVGNAWSPARPIVYSGGRMFDLNELIDDHSYSIASTYGVDEAGNIVATAGHGYARAVILRPR